MAKVIASRSLRFRNPKGTGNAQPFEIAASINEQEVPAWVLSTHTYRQAEKSQWIRQVTANPFQAVPSPMDTLTDAQILAEAHKRSLDLVGTPGDLLEPEPLDLSTVSTEDLWAELDKRGDGESLHGSPLAAIEEAERLRREAAEAAAKANPDAKVPVSGETAGAAKAKAAK